MRVAVTSLFAAAEAGRLRSVTKARAEMTFDIDDSFG
jgi:hypothetical protein